MIPRIWEQGSLSKGSPIFFWGIKEERAAALFELKQREQLLIRVEAKLTDFRTIPRAWTLILHASPSETKKKESTRVGPTDKFEQSKEKNYPPTSLVTSALYILCVGKGSLLRSVCTEWTQGRESARRGWKPRATPLVF